MPGDLVVDTIVLARAAEQLHAAANVLDRAAIGPGRFTVSADSLGGDALAREFAALCARRLVQVTEAAAELGNRVGSAADALEVAVARFRSADDPGRAPR